MVFLAVEAHPDGTNSGRDIVYIRLQGDDGLAITFRDLERSHLGSIKIFRINLNHASSLGA